MRKHLFFLILCTAGMLLDATAQFNFLEGKDAYLGQKPPGDQPEVFAENMLMINDTFPMGRVAFYAAGVSARGTTGVLFYLFDHWDDLAKRYRGTKVFCVALRISSEDARSCVVLDQTT